MRRSQEQQLRLSQDPYLIGWSEEQIEIFRVTEAKRAKDQGNTVDLLEFPELGKYGSTRLYNSLICIGIKTAEGVRELLAQSKAPRGISPRSWQVAAASYQDFQQRYGSLSDEELKTIYQQQRERKLKGHCQAGMTDDELAQFLNQETARSEQQDSPGLDQLGWDNYTTDFYLRWGSVRAKTRNILQDFGIKTVEGARQILSKLEQGGGIFGIGPDSRELLTELLDQYDQQHPQEHYFVSQ